MEMHEHLPEVISEAQILAGNTNKLPRIFWRLVERLAPVRRYKVIQECEARNWLIPERERLFADYFRTSLDYELRRSYYDYRRGWLADAYNDITYWRKISGGN